MTHVLLCMRDTFNRATLYMLFQRTAITKWLLTLHADGENGLDTVMLLTFQIDRKHIGVFNIWSLWEAVWSTVLSDPYKSLGNYSIFLGQSTSLAFALHNSNQVGCNRCRIYCSIWCWINSRNVWAQSFKLRFSLAVPLLCHTRYSIVSVTLLSLLSVLE